jgi:hypothetical protein
MLIPPAQLTVHHAELVRRSPRIALARFERSSVLDDDRYTQSFTTVKVVKGSIGAHFSLVFTGGAPVLNFRDRKDADFHGHTIWEFWEEKFARTYNRIAECVLRSRSARPT